MIKVGFLIFPHLQQLDITAPYEIFAAAQEIEIELIGQNMNPIQSVSGLEFHPTATYQTCGHLNILCIPSGKGITNLMEDTPTIRFIKQKAQEADYVTSICTGSLLLGVAGLLENKKATCHWSALDLLSYFGATPKKERVVFDGNLVTAGGVTSGIDFALTLIARIFDKKTAEKIQLHLQYAPQPPFNAGTPDEAPTEIYKTLLQQGRPIYSAREKIAKSWKKSKMV